MAAKITGKTLKRPVRTVSVKLHCETIVQLKRRAKSEKRTPHAFMRDAILRALAA
jgi:hypothetical protein